MIRKEDLTATQWGMLLGLRWAKAPGQNGKPNDRTLRALERRGLAQSRVDPVTPTLSLWTITAAGIALMQAAGRE